MTISHPHEIRCRYFFQEDLLGAGCLDIELAIDAAEKSMCAFRYGDVLFPEKIVQIFNDETQERITHRWLGGRIRGGQALRQDRVR
jgi:hypothetical protein